MKEELKQLKMGRSTLISLVENLSLRLDTDHGIIINRPFAEISIQYDLTCLNVLTRPTNTTTSKDNLALMKGI